MKKRIVYFDVLKVTTCFMVIMIHVISRNWYVLDLKSNEFTFLTILDSFCRCAVPIYLMISGAIFLNEDKNIKIKDMFRKYILNIFLIYLFWNMTYSILNIIVYGNKIINVKVLKDIFISTILGNGIFHLKFLVTIIGFYLCVPFVRCIAKKENKNLLQYLIILLFIFTCTPSILTVFNINLKYPTLFTGFTLYFILGYYLNTFEINKKYFRLISVLLFNILLFYLLLLIKSLVFYVFISFICVRYGSYYAYQISIFIISYL